MPHKLIDAFYWCNIAELNGGKLTDSEKYQRIVNWAGKARGQNPGAFDALTEWVLDDSEWRGNKLCLLYTSVPVVPAVFLPTTAFQKSLGCGRDRLDGFSGASPQCPDIPPFPTARWPRGPHRPTYGLRGF